MINKLLKTYEISNRVNLDKKTPIQKRIEFITTNERCYEEVPYVKFLGDKIALRTWLKFSKIRFFYSYNYEERPNLLERKVATLFEYASTMQKISEKSFN